jgi:phage terminase Nu1 subunit (DNA packaging protein)
METADKLLKTKKMAEVLDCSTRHLTLLISKGLPHYRLSGGDGDGDGDYRFNPTEVMEWMRVGKRE